MWRLCFHLVIQIEIHLENVLSHRRKKLHCSNYGMEKPSLGSIISREKWLEFFKKEETNTGVYLYFFLFSSILLHCGSSLPRFRSFLPDSTLFLTWQILWISYCREKLSCVCLHTHVFVGYVSQELGDFLYSLLFVL